MQHPTALSFLLVVYARYMSQGNRVIHCGGVVATPARLIQVARGQVCMHAFHGFSKWPNLINFDYVFSKNSILAITPKSRKFHLVIITRCFIKMERVFNHFPHESEFSNIAILFLFLKMIQNIQKSFFHLNFC